MKPHNLLFFSAFAAALILSVLTIPALAADDNQSDHRQHQAHKHGSARLSIAIDNNELLIDLNTPAINLLGFEHKPANTQQQQQVEQAVKLLDTASQIFTLPSEAHCNVERAQVQTALLPSRHNAHHSAVSADPQHNDFVAEYHYQCNNMTALTQITVKLFQHFPATHDIDVEIITDKNQSALELSKSDNVIRF